MDRDRCPDGMLIHPLVHKSDLYRWVLRDNSAWSGSAARVNLGYDLLGVHQITDAAVDPISLPLLCVDIKPASLYERRRLRPSRLCVLLPPLRYGYNQRKHRAQPSEENQQNESGKGQSDLPHPLRHRHSFPSSRIGMRLARFAFPRHLSMLG